MTPLTALSKLYRSPYLMLDPGDAGTIYADRQFGVVPLVSAGAETRTLEAPTKAGIQIMLECVTYVGAITLTVKDTATATTYTVGYSAAGQWVKFESIQASSTNYKWQVVASYGVSGCGASSSTLDVSGVSNFAAAANFAAGAAFGSTVTIVDNKNFVINGTTGTRFGTASTAKIGLWGATPVVQPAGVTAVSANAGLGASTAAGSVYVLNTTNFSGGVGTKNYTIGDIVLALKQAGILASS